MNLQNTDFKTLVQTAQVQGLSLNQDLPQATRSILERADQAQRQLSSDELTTICQVSGIDVSLADNLIQRSDQLVNQARAHLIATQPHLVQPGGALHPEDRAEACWRDCWNFLRVITYAVACNQSCFTNPSGMAALRELYRRMNVPIEGMNIALGQLKEKALEGVSRSNDRQLINDCFQHLRDQLNKTAVKS
ncbi:MAG: phycobilisome polypeptide [Cyanobacteria bacterium MAG COS1_bin_9]|uniref:phycobilisome polypeptide n=1 Tax=Synechococcus sp. RS9902 TaxID=221345 RepID=UPI001645E978|nr:phycobilisome polypeptide [Synechococcus sp. RS9902]MCY4083424.1 phycobilisome polypeptide [Cyanobacteria bacterium MAG COS1_bin_9]MDD9803760.1 phycobilisome polypeptide [Cyanobacteria bacterium MAG STY1_bin_7]MDD9862665.1 phycobilisome polypeptide [Cyanobacteria bacterium MAG STY2_bin_7]QNI96375.1 allophycocyanin-like protein [Synechococcus sp. RS9902]